MKLRDISTSSRFLNGGSEVTDAGIGGLHESHPGSDSAQTEKYPTTDNLELEMDLAEVKALCHYLIKLQLDPNFQASEREVYQRKKAQAISK